MTKPYGITVLKFFLKYLAKDYHIKLKPKRKPKNNQASTKAVSTEVLSEGVNLPEGVKYDN